MTVRTRQILVKEAASLFDLKPGVVEDADDDDDDPNISSGYPKDELNSAIGYTSQMLDLIVRYLGIKLPFCLFRKDIYTYIRSIPHSRLYQNQSKMPLYLENDKNFRRFLIGVSMLNYNIVYLCYTQGVHIPLSQVANTLQNLLACCNAPGLGL
ncbi:UV radiation resistance protein and autophagy-related subunit 14-domain-containing protein [Absidia repens]|uniref:Autophagy-related protein 14 n=1 Tax=Absidia repens TaxID=90262 RepID=A0A1X2IE73_9FUNG|nr:UV radiation resistance protein and autophagy-related subunit 14-domain-containing protein [Absidia repens]